MEVKYKVEREFIPINLLIAFLVGLAAAIFVIAAKETFGLSIGSQALLSIFVGIVYLVIAIFMLIPKKVKTPIEIPERIVFHHDPKQKPKEVIKFVDRVVEKKVHVPVHTEKVITKTIHKKGDAKIAIVHVEKKKKKKSLYMGSTYNEKYHMRTCRFSGAIKKKYLVEENDRKFFKLRGYSACKVCRPQYN